LYEIPTELSSLMNLSVTMGERFSLSKSFHNGPIIGLNLTILTTLKKHCDIDKS